MDQTSILITGASGQLGLALQKKYPKARIATSQILDISDKKSVSSFDWRGIKILINAAAYTDVDGAETPEGRLQSWATNAVGVANLVKIATQQDLTLVQISSDYVFDGTERTPHTEDEPFSPLSVYGSSKAAGDLAASLTPKFYIIRTSWVVGEGKNFVRTMVNLAEKNISPTVVGDQIGRLTFTSTLAEAINHLLVKKEPYGTYNVSNGGQEASWADITREIFKNLNRPDLSVTDTSTTEYFAGKQNVAPRPLNSTLNLNKITNSGYSPQHWKEALSEYLKV